MKFRQLTKIDLFGEAKKENSLKSLPPHFVISYTGALVRSSSGNPTPNSPSPSLSRSSDSATTLMSLTYGFDDVTKCKFAYAYIAVSWVLEQLWGRFLS